MLRRRSSSASRRSARSRRPSAEVPSVMQLKYRIPSLSMSASGASKSPGWSCAGSSRYPSSASWRSSCDADVCSATTLHSSNASRFPRPAVIATDGRLDEWDRGLVGAVRHPCGPHQQLGLDAVHRTRIGPGDPDEVVRDVRAVGHGAHPPAGEDAERVAREGRDVGELVELEVVPHDVQLLELLERRPQRLLVRPAAGAVQRGGAGADRDVDLTEQAVDEEARPGRPAGAPPRLLGGERARRGQVDRPAVQHPVPPRERMAQRRQGERQVVERVGRAGAAGAQALQRPVRELGERRRDGVRRRREPRRDVVAAQRPEDLGEPRGPDARMVHHRRPPPVRSRRQQRRLARRARDALQVEPQQGIVIGPRAAAGRGQRRDGAHGGALAGEGVGRPRTGEQPVRAAPVRRAAEQQLGLLEQAGLPRPDVRLGVGHDPRHAEGERRLHGVERGVDQRPGQLVAVARADLRGLADRPQVRDQALGDRRRPVRRQVAMPVQRPERVPVIAARQVVLRPRPGVGGA